MVVNVVRVDYRNSLVKSRSSFLHLLFALLLLLAQQLAMTHAISHIDVPQSATQEKHLPEAGHCDQCLSFSSLGTAVSTTHQNNFASLYQQVRIQPDFDGQVFPLRQLAFHSRAPPLDTRTI